MSDAEWVVVYSRQAQKDAHKLASSGLKAKAQVLLDLVAQDPFSSPPRFENLVGDLAGCYSRRINIQHRLVYEVLPEERVVHVLRMWTRYE
ncbi:MAG: Txe/YoeB family addiction module toxin [Candidatus Lutibacillus vidarii]|nr:Txe/YoeB family addiction module toxin [Candidatus Lutibacillus vidarii]